MPIGPAVRRLFGPYEEFVASAYRRLFIDLPHLARALPQLAPAQDVLEVGAGEGFLATALLEANPGMSYTGIDITPRTGRLFKGDRSAATFRTMPLSALDGQRTFDLVLMADVLHHVPENQRSQLIADAWAHVRPDGALAVKDWERGRSPVHAACYGSDRFITGDRVSYMTRDELVTLVKSAVGQAGKISETRIRPWKNNILLVLHKPPA